jgi:hypothetical protein
VSIPTPPENADYLQAERRIYQIFRIIQDVSGRVQDFASLARVWSVRQRAHDGEREGNANEDCERI